MNINWDGRVPDWGLEPVNVNQKGSNAEAQKDEREKQASEVALAEQAKQVEKRKQEEVARIAALTTEIKGGTPETGKVEEKHPPLPDPFLQECRDIFEEITGGDMEKIQVAAIIEKYLREEIKERGIIVNEHSLDRLLSIIETRNDEGDVVGYGKVDLHQTLMPEAGTDNLIVSDRVLGGGYKKPFLDERSPELRQQDELEFKQLREALLAAKQKAMLEIAAMSHRENEEYHEIRKESIEGGVNIIPRGEHWVIGSIQGGVIKVSEGAKLTVLDLVEDGVVSGDDGSKIEILGKQKGGIVKNG